MRHRRARYDEPLAAQPLTCGARSFVRPQFAALEEVNGLIIEANPLLTTLDELTSLRFVNIGCTITPASLLETAPENVRQACGELA